MAEKIKTMVIFEMLGRPPEYLKETMTKLIDTVSKEKGIEMINRRVHEPKKIEGQDLFTTFAETEIDFADIISLLRIIFSYMPSHIEIIAPEELKLKNFDFNSVANELISKLHQYDEIAKRLVIERGILLQQMEKLGVKPAIFQNQAQAKPEEKKVKEKTKKAKKKKI